MTLVDRARFETVQEVFREALTAEPDDVPALLESRCRGDEDLRRRVEELLAASREAGDFLEGGPIEAEADDAEALVGTSVDRYRVICRLGEGGMGVVYLAERADDTFRKRVAIKVLQPGGASREMVGRFLVERQILAGLEHPAIATLLDGGTTGDGLHYLVMEYVEGEPIDEHCEVRDLPLDRRLELFLELCDAVQFAHGNLVVHRDLKPGNVLVTADGDLKLLDFGIAKLLNPALAAPTGGPTLTMLRLMTPEYASPEQVRGGPITTATDVYSLGVLLDRILTGRGGYPFGDLGAIVRKARDERPERRYASVALLAEDIRRHRHGLTVRARPRTLAYRGSKFLRRYRWPLLATAAVLIVVFTLGWRLAGEMARVESALTAAELERERGERLVDFVVTLFAVPNPRTDPSDTVSAQDLMRHAADRLKTELADQPRAQARARTEIARILAELGEYDQAAVLAGGAVTSLRELGEDRLTARALEVLASVRIGQGRIDEAGTLLADARDLLEGLAAGADPDLAHVLHEQALVHLYGSRLTEARDGVERALAMERAVDREVGGEPAERAQMLNTLGSIHLRAGDLFEAETIYRQTLALRLDAFDPDHLAVSESRNNLAAVLSMRGEAEEAEGLFRQVLAVRREVLGEEHPQVATAWHNLGGTLRDLGDPVAAEAAYGEAIGIYERTVGRNHHLTAGSLLRLGAVLEVAGDLRGAERSYRDSLAIHRSTLGHGHPKSAETELFLARLLAERGALDEAYDLAERAEGTLAETRGPDHWQTAAAATVRATCLVARGEVEDGRRLAGARSGPLETTDPLARRFREDAAALVTGP